jgi:uncharacterized protein YjbI with pentapeptide repeats
VSRRGITTQAASRGRSEVRIPPPKTEAFLKRLRIPQMARIIKNSQGDVLVVIPDERNPPGYDTFLDHDLTDAVFEGLILEGARFDDCNLTRASFRGTDLYWASFMMSNAECADFEGADLRGANFTDGSFRNCNFKNANLGRDNVGGYASFVRADLRGADFRNTILDGIEFAGAKHDSSTLFPANFSATTRGLVKIDIKA